MHEKDPFDNLPHELLRTTKGVSVEVSKYVSEEESPLLWDMIQTGFIDLNNHSHDRQDMTREEFLSDIESPRVLKYITRDRDNRPMGYLTVHVGLDDITWTDAESLAKAQTKIDSQATPYYVGTLVVPVDKRGSDVATLLLQGALLHFREANQKTGEQALCFFDCAQANHPWLAHFIKKASRPAQDFEGIPIDITELYKEQLSKDSITSSKPIKLRVPPNTPDSDTIVDSQHYYAVRILPESI